MDETEPTTPERLPLARRTPPPKEEPMEIADRDTIDEVASRLGKWAKDDDES
ncbi:MAG: hypothetical protein JJE52_02920 [Acidimicrobiia bacterium]|nr:hypothetical protein [Acidimicrobiia bacterium]